jgi:hypothetical protein
MIDIPIGKALAPVEGNECMECFFHADKMINGNEKRLSLCNLFDCAEDDREDGVDVIFKLADWPAKEEK